MLAFSSKKAALFKLFPIHSISRRDGSCTETAFTCMAQLTYRRLTSVISYTLDHKNYGLENNSQIAP